MVGFTSGLSSVSASAFKSPYTSYPFAFPQLHTPTPLSNNTGHNYWRFASSKLSSTYIEITRRRIYVKDLFRGYLTWWSTFFLKQKSGLRILQRIYRSQPLYIMLLRSSLSIIEKEEHEDGHLLRSALSCLITQTSAHAYERQILEMIIHESHTICPSLKALNTMTEIALARYDQALNQLSIPSMHPDADEVEEKRVAIIVNRRQQVVSRQMLWRFFIVMIIIIVTSCLGLFFIFNSANNNVNHDQRLLATSISHGYDSSKKVVNDTFRRLTDELLIQRSSELEVKWAINGVSHC